MSRHQQAPARREVTIRADDANLSAWFYEPAAAPPWPAVAMAHGFGGVKDLNLPRFAEAFRAAGLAVLIFDHRNFGGSTGEPRQDADPWAQMRDYRHAISWLEHQGDIAGDRIGIWGTSYSGGHVLVAAALDRRVRCVVSQVPAISGAAALDRRDPALRAMLAAAFAADRANRFRGEPPAMIQLYPLDPAKPAAMTADNVLDHHLRSQAEGPVPAWRNEVTLRSLEMATEYEPGAYSERIAPTPLLMIVAECDTTTPSDLALRCFKRAGEPKRLELVAGATHFDVYHRAGFKLASDAATAWFTHHLNDYVATSAPG